MDKQLDLQGADLHGVDLRGADLSSVNLSGANLCEADLRGANLCGADCSMANLKQANLTEAGMIMANLKQANLRGGLLARADLRSANLIGADLRGASLLDANLHGASLAGILLSADQLTLIHEVKDSDPFAEFNKLLAVATVSQRFRQTLLTNPAQAIVVGQGESYPKFNFSAAECELILSIKARTMEEFAQQLIPLLRLV